MEPTVILEGELSAWTKRGNEPNSAAVRGTCKWEIREHHGTQVTFALVEGGVTGYESFGLKDEKGVRAHMIEWVFGKDIKYWPANAGGMGWREQRVPIKFIREIVTNWLKTQDALISQCMKCHKVIGFKEAEGAEGGISHGICDACEEESCKK